MIVVFDTNIWKSSLYLQSPAAAATRLFLRQKGARVGLPEVVRLELERHLKKDVRVLIETTRSNHERLLRMFGTLRELVLPTDNHVEELSARIYEALGVELVDIPFSLESARDSFLRTVDKTPPSDRTQQFKDGVLWADCVALLQAHEVWLVTDDHAFYEDHTPEKGIVQALAAEVANASHRLSLVSSLGGLLRDFRVELELDAETLSKVILQETKNRAIELITRNGFDLGERTKLQRNLFATEDPRILFLEFVIEYECPDATASGRPPAVLTIKGDATFNTETNMFSKLRSFGEALRFTSEDGTEKELKNVVMHAEGIVLGHRHVSNTVRYKLDE